MPKKEETSNTANNTESTSASGSTVEKLGGVIEVPQIFLDIPGFLLKLLVLYWAITNAFRIRTYALEEFGMVIHEFDPWFNFRATQYLSKHGWHAFFHWFDYKVWYPLGRPVGTTIYPGLQITAVAVHRFLKWMGDDWKMTLNDVCCTMPCWGGAVATFFLGLTSYEVSNNFTAAVISATIMAVIPAHMMRSVGGGYDNECIAMSAIIATFFFWIRSLRTHNSWVFGVLAGLSYGYMVAAWGGFIFVLNMVALHAALITVIDWARGKYSSRVHRSYTLFFVIGTAIATRVPPVSMMPFKSLEQLFAFAVFLGLQFLYISEIMRRNAKVEILSAEGFRIRFKCITALLIFVGSAVVILWPTGFFGPLSSRIRGLFVQHTRTGNPLVDSVAEHQPASADAYWHYLHYCCYGWTAGTVIILTKYTNVRYRAAVFCLAYSFVAYFFSLKMARLIIITAPIASIATGAAVAELIHWCIGQFFWSDYDLEVAEKAKEGKDAQGRPVLKKNSDHQSIDAAIKKVKLAYRSMRHARIAVAVIILAIIASNRHWSTFNEHAEHMAHSFSNPQLMFKTRLQNGQTVMIDDYREAYFWLRDKTPKDSRVMAWWDYGYQITGIGSRTSIADGNTWNHEHIATLGKCLTSPVAEAHSLVRHLADYVLIWSGGGGDDLAKSPHMARIGNSVYHDICPKDPLCMHFGFRGQNHQDPTPMMRKSLLYNLHAHGNRPGVRIPSKLFTEAYTSKYGLVRIFKVANVSQESKDWVADPKNRVCDAPGSWYCPGQYPPAPEIQDLLARKMDFAQLEDFNRKGGDKSKIEEYQKRYHERMRSVHGG